MNRKNLIRIITLIGLVIVLSMSGCATLSDIRMPGTSSSGRTAEQGNIITGTVLIQKSTYLINERNTGNLYTLISIAKDMKQELTRLRGKLIRVEVKIVSNPSPGNYNAQLIRILY